MKFQAPVELFPMEEKDLNGVAALESEVQSFPWNRELFRDSLHNGHSCWICRIGGELAGFSIMMLVVDEAHLLNIAIRPSLQGQGLGARLLKNVMAVARKGGAVSLFLEVRVSNRKAADLYRNFGFRQIGERKDYYPAENGRENALVFSRELA